MTPQQPPKKSAPRRPRILVLEGLSGAASCVRRAGGDPIMVNPRNLWQVDKALGEPFDGLLLTGGGDVDPTLYGETAHPKVYGVSATRDYTEWTALNAARDAGVPVLGICRGMQLMAVHNGGVLKQHVSGHRGTPHLVLTQPGSRFRKILKGNGGVFVSLHHQQVLRTGPGWRVGGRDPEGKIEVVESRDGRSLGVQFHPEMDYARNEGSRRLFRWLVVEAAKRAGLPIPRVPRIQREQPRQLPRGSSGVRARTPLDDARQLSFDPPARRVPRRPIASRWFCRDCGMQFDKQQDRDDHEYWICGTPELRVSEPPPGHPDWMGAS